MERVTAHLTFQNDTGTLWEYEFAHPVRDGATQRGREALASELATELQVQMTYADLGTAIPEPPDLLTSNGRRVPFEEFVSRVATSGMWLEIQNTLLEFRFLLSLAMAFKNCEPPVSTDGEPQSVVNKRWFAHMEKMLRLDSAVSLLVKVQDLTVRLLFENFGADLIETDMTQDGWERDLKLSEAKEGLQKRLDAGELAQPEFDAIIDALEQPRKSVHARLLIDYRNRATHRIRPSVDYPELFTHIQGRGTPLINKQGDVVGKEIGLFERRSSAEFTSSELVTALIEYYGHICEMLRRLKTLPRFG